MRRIIIISALALLVSASIATAGFRGQRGPDGRGQDGGRGMRQGNVLAQANELGLTDDQVEKIKDLSYTHRAAMIDFRSQLEKARLEMHHEMQSDNPSQEKVLALTRQMNDIKGQMAEASTRHRFDVRGLLTAEQLDKLKTLQGPGRGGPGMGMTRGQGGQGAGGMRKRDGSCGR